MLDSELRDELVQQVERAQISALHRALDKAWLEGYLARGLDNARVENMSSNEK
jgi:hypothetical protein